MSVRGNAAKAYDAYYAEWVAKNGEVQALNIVSMFDEEGAKLGALVAQGAEQTSLGNVYRRYNLVLLVDGRAVEPSVDSRGNWIYAVFDTLDKATSYDRPMTMKEMYDWW